MSVIFDRLQAAGTYVQSGRFTQAFIVYWQRFCERLETVISDLQAVNDTQDGLIADLQQAQADITAAQADITAAQADIEATQQEQADQLALIMATQVRVAILNSFTTGGSILSASDAGSDATITVANHTRYYNGLYPSVAITGGSITALAYSTTYYVYYDDPTLANTAPTFVATTSAAEAQANQAEGRHPLGPITTPAAGGGGTSGGGTTPPGGGGGGGALP